MGGKKDDLERHSQVRLYARYSHNAAGAYASENETVRDMTRHFYPEQLPLSTEQSAYKGVVWKGP